MGILQKDAKLGALKGKGRELPDPIKIAGKTMDAGNKSGPGCCLSGCRLIFSLTSIASNDNMFRATLDLRPPSDVIRKISHITEEMYYPYD